MAGWLISAVLFAALIACLWRLRRIGREAARLSEEIDRFLSGEANRPSFSVRDDFFARFENAVTELESRLLASEERGREARSRAAEGIVDISHQLKTPIAALRLYCELEGGDPRQLRLIERLERLLAALMTLEKLRAEGFAFHFGMASLAEIAEEAVSRVAPLFAGREIRVEGDAQMRLDAGWMEEALVNLLKNACEHTGPDGQIRVEIERAEASAFVVVQDDGGGVPPDEVGQLFRRFFRSSASSSKDGVGVGLAIVRAIVEKHHGSVTAENAKGGLRVTVCLPVWHDRLMKT